MRCRVVYQGAGHNPAIRIGNADRKTFFRQSNSRISIEIDKVEGYTTLQRDFFGNVGQIRTIYSTKEYGGINLLIDWINDNKLKVGDNVELDVIIPFKKYRLKKV